MADSFGDLLRRFRIAASLTQEALAERCRISPVTIAAIEQGRRKAPRLSTVRLIAEALELSAADRASLALSASGGLHPDGLAGQQEQADRPARGAEVARKLPSPITPLFGRHADTDEVIHELASERLVTLVGPGGVGKTRLAVEVATAMLGKFAGGTFWVDLGSVGDPAGMQEAVLTSLSAVERPSPAVREQIVAALQGAPALLVFDNCEHLLDAAAELIAELLARSPVTVVATSREPLAIPGEVRWQVPALAVPPASPQPTAEDLSGVSSVELFVDRASRAAQRFVVTDADAPDIARVCRRLEGLPLAIELAAARLGSLRLGQLANELDEQIPLAAASARGVPPRHTTLWACIDWSYRLLSAPEQAAFRQLAAFAGPFTEQAFAAVIEHADRSGPRPAAALHAPAALYALADKSLVSAEAGGRYSVLDTIRAFASEKAREAAELTAIRDSHADYYASWLTDLDAAEASDLVLDLIEADYLQLRAALVWSIETRSPRAAAIVAGLGNGWQERAHFSDARILGDAALATADGRDRPLWAKAVASLAMARLLGGDMAFLPSVSRAEAIAAAAGDNHSAGWCQLALGTRPPFDRDLLASAYDLGAAESRPVLAGLAATFLGYGGTDPDREQWLRRGREFSDKLSNTTLSASSRIAWADSLVERGRMAEALDLAVPAASDPQVMPTLRLLGIGRITQVAFYRRDTGLADLARTMGQDLSNVWPPGSAWLTSTWNVYGNLLQMWSSLLRGDPPPPPDLSTLGRATRMALTPATVRTICRAGIGRGDRISPVDVAMATAAPASGSLMDASFAAVQAAYAFLDGDHALAERRWSHVLRSAAPHQYLLLVCDALDGLGCTAAARGDTVRAGQLISAAQSCRDDISYHFRFPFEQDLLAAATAAIRPAAAADHPEPAALTWQAAIGTALDG
jgi:predicted ATPase/DNA-binding XRE family transcriptional regulator